MIKRTLKFIEEQIGLKLEADKDFPGVYQFQKEKYFNVELKDRVSRSKDYQALERFSKKYNYIKVEPNGLNKVAIFPKGKLLKKS